MQGFLVLLPTLLFAIFAAIVVLVATARKPKHPQDDRLQLHE
jgi:hypothetical protein